ncbi:MAG: head maturation protease, ClpP-related [Allosphingosinicella sp.]
MSALSNASVLDRWSEEAAGVRAVAAGDNVITMFGIIGEDFWDEGITAKRVAAQLRAIGDRPVEVQINSPGGDMFEAIAIYNVLREHAQSITVKIVGMAGSAASIVAMAGDQIEIGAASFIMIHNCWVLAIGNRHDMAETSEWLAPFDAAMRDVYAQRTGQKPAEIEKWMDAETYMSGSLAIERGFADGLLPSDQVETREAAKSRDREVNELRALELSLVHGGMPRTQARERIKKIKGSGTPGAADPPGDVTPGADDPALAVDLAAFIEQVKA